MSSKTRLYHDKPKVDSMDRNLENESPSLQSKMLKKPIASARSCSLDSESQAKQGKGTNGDGCISISSSAEGIEVDQEQNLKSANTKHPKRSLRNSRFSSSVFELNDGFAVRNESPPVQQRSVAPVSRPFEKKSSFHVLLVAVVLALLMNSTLESIWPPLVPFIYEYETQEKLLICFIVKPFAEALGAPCLNRHYRSIPGPAQQSIIGLVLLNIAAFIFMTTKTFENVLVARMLHGIGSTLLKNSKDSLFRLGQGKEKARVAGCKFLLLDDFGSILGPVSALVLYPLSEHLPFVIIGSLLGFSLCLYLFFFCCSFEESDENLPDLASESIPLLNDTAERMQHQVRTNAFNPSILFLLSAILFVSAVFSMVEFVLPRFIKQELVNSPRALCTYWVVVPISRFSATAFGTSLFHRLRTNMKLVAVGFLIQACSLVVVALPELQGENINLDLARMEFILGLVMLAGSYSVLMMAVERAIFFKHQQNNILAKICNSTGYIVGPVVSFFSTSSESYHILAFVLGLFSFTYAFASLLNKNNL